MFIVMSPVEFMQRLTFLVFRSRFNLIQFVVAHALSLFFNGKKRKMGYQLGMFAEVSI